MSEFKPHSAPAPEDHRYRDPKPGGSRPTLYQWTDAVIDDESLSPTLKCTLLVLTRWMDQHGRCWPSRTTIAAKLGVTKRTAQRNLTEAESLGWISRDEDQPIVLHACFPTQNIAEDDSQKSPKPPEEGMTLMTKTGHQRHGGVTSVAQKRSPVSRGGDICDAKTVTSVTLTTQELPNELPNELPSGGGAISAQGSTLPPADDNHNHPPQAQTIREMADCFKVAVYPGTEAKLWHQTLDAIGDERAALCFIRDKFQQWSGKDVNAKGVMLWLRRDAPEWLEMRPVRRGNATSPALKTTAASDATTQHDGDPEPGPEALAATPEHAHYRAIEAWRHIRRKLEGLTGQTGLDLAARLRGLRLTAGELVVGGDPVDVMIFRDDYADLIPMDKLRAEFGVERITWHVPGEVQP